MAVLVRQLVALCQKTENHKFQEVPVEYERASFWVSLTCSCEVDAQFFSHSYVIKCCVLLYFLITMQSCDSTEMMPWEAKGTCYLMALHKDMQINKN